MAFIEVRADTEKAYRAKEVGEHAVANLTR